MPYDFHNLNFLVVEANKTMQSLERSVLRAFGIDNVMSFDDGEEAYLSLQKEPQDVAIITWHMPPTNGVDFTRKVRASPERLVRFLPIIMLTAYSDKRRVLMARDAGVTEFLVKPFTPHALYTHIASIVEHPRPFVECDAFFGPERRRKNQEFAGIDRRSNEQPGMAEKAAVTTTQTPQVQEGSDG